MAISGLELWTVGFGAWSSVGGPIRGDTPPQRLTMGPDLKNQITSTYRSSTMDIVSNYFPLGIHRWVEFWKREFRLVMSSSLGKLPRGACRQSSINFYAAKANWRQHPIVQSCLYLSSCIQALRFSFKAFFHQLHHPELPRAFPIDRIGWGCVNSQD